jgi:short-subunit dehydrogenase
LKSYSRALNVEVKDKYVSVTAVCPGWMQTGFMQEADV